VETLDGLKDGPNLHPLHAPSGGISRRSAAIGTPGMLMAAKALLDHNPKPSRERSSTRSRQHLPLYRYEPIINAVARRASGGRARA